MNFLNKLERRFGRYAIRNLPAIMIGLYAAGYLLSVMAPNILNYLTLEPYYILRGQVWRIITWVIVPPGSPGIFTIIMLLFYFSIGQTLERTWGAFRFNVYIFSGVIFTVIGAMLLYAFCATQGTRYLFSSLFSTYYINMSIFLAFALEYPNMQVLLYFIIPVKMKWMGILYAALIAYDFFMSSAAQRVAIIASLLNFLIFFFATRDYSKLDPNEIKRRRKFSQAMKQGPQSSAGRTHTGSARAGTGAKASHERKPIHRCAVCGRTELDGDDLVFRYCSKCDGAYEYCQDHLFNHTHVHNS